MWNICVSNPKGMEMPFVAQPLGPKLQLEWPQGFKGSVVFGMQNCIIWRYPPPTNSEIIICSFLWRAPYKPSLSTVSGPGIPPMHYVLCNSPNCRIFFLCVDWKVGWKLRENGWHVLMESFLTNQYITYKAKSTRVLLPLHAKNTLGNEH